MSILEKDRTELAILAKTLYDETHSPTIIAKKLSVSATTVYRLLHEAGVSIDSRKVCASRRAKLQGSVKEEVVAAYANGWSMRKFKQRFRSDKWRFTLH